MDVYQVITDRIISILESGTVPWRKPWKTAGIEGMPKNLVSGKEYRGINVFMLQACGYDSPYWLTFNQAKKLGGHVKKGERSNIVVFWNWLTKETNEIDSTGKRIVSEIPFLRYYRVFNICQCELSANLIPDTPPTPEIEPIAACEQVVSAMPNRPAISHTGGNRAFYRKSTDSVHLPERSRFYSSEEYYSTLFHELTHSTGHASRLNRKTLTDSDGFGGETYSREELVAEMGTAFLCGVTAIEPKTLDNSAAYIASWLGALRDDKRMIVTAAAQAQKAADFILNKKTPAGQ